ncbi:methyl-accepting chemotaxis protein [Clostridium thailandense]|uniref:methyl-accepting chemotaxis protein n=1 Tax=Clostridium thailandense TaxID=2794346 RepID=UPI003989D93F
MKKSKIESVNFTIKTKLVLISSLLLIVPILILGLISYNVSKQHLADNGKILLKNSVEMTLQQIDANQKLVDAGKLTLDAAQENVREYMLGKKKSDGTRPINKNINLGANGYMLAYTQDGHEAVHPSLEGQSVWDVKDKKNGSYLVQEQIKIGNNGGGYLNYWWTIPNSNTIAQKVTYQKVDPNWKWVVSAGTYMSDFDKGSNEILKIMIIVLISLMIIGGLIILAFSHHIAYPIRKISEAVDIVAAGNFNIPELNIKNNDETGKLKESFTIMVQNIGELINSIKQSTNVVVDSTKVLDKIVAENTSSTNEVASSIEGIAKSSSEQAKDTEEGVTRIKNLSDKIDLVTDLALQSSSTAEEANNFGHEGLNVVRMLIEKSKDNINSTVKASEIIYEVDEISIEIGSITEAISEISTQTNLLALNAAIEAARAGEQGRGFAVVAEEVRKLASESSQAAAKVKELIDGIQNKSKIAVQAIDKGKIIAREQEKAVKSTEDIFNKISMSIDKIVDNVKNIKDSSTEMDKEKNKMIEILENLSASTEENSAASQQVAAATEEQLANIEHILSNTQQLKNLADELKKSINKFEI